MYINQTSLNFGSNHSYGNVPKSIVLHHAEASNCSVYDVHQWHRNNGWAGIGYHYFVRKDGSIWKGRPDDMVGSHVAGFNQNSLGICAEGSYMSETMPQAQKNSIVELCKYLCNKYGIKKIYGHKEVGSSNCPGTKYPLNEIKNAVISGGSSSSGGNSSSGGSSTGGKPTMVVNTPSGINVREQKSTSAKILGAIPNGGSAEVYRIEGEWVHIYYPPHGGYVSKQYVKLYNVPDSMIQKPSTSTSTNLYRVRKSWADVKSQVGAYSVLENAIDECKKHAGYSVFDANGKIVYPKSESKPDTPNPPKPQTPKTPISGKPILTTEQMAQFVLKINSNPKIQCTIQELAQMYLDEGNIENIKGDIAFCQAIKETGYFKFGGDMVPEQNNYCGLGTTGGGVKGAYFKTPQEGVRAHIQHLKAYASKDSLKNPCIDPRYSLVEKGSAPNWEDLNGKWAVPGNNYGEEIIIIHDTAKNTKVEGGKKMDLVVYFGEVDHYGALYVGDFLKLPVISLKYFNENTNVKNNANKVYLVGGSEKDKPIENTVLIAGNNRKDTAIEVAKFI